MNMKGDRLEMVHRKGVEDDGPHYYPSKRDVTNLNRPRQ